MATIDTIVAIATPPGYGGVGIVRLSGPEAYAIALQLTPKQTLSPRKAMFSPIINQQHELIDQGIFIYFKAPDSFTGEDIVEIHGHGSPVVLDYILTLCIQNGARLANPGEFSLRAFLNDKMDLTQAEAIADLIHASSLTAAKMAIKSLQGEFSKAIQVVNEKLIYLRMYVEAAIDFPEEEIDFLNDGKVFTMLQCIIKELNDIRKQAMEGSRLFEGISVVIAGRPNAGKSTLINCLAKRDVAIVTEIAGTTRDVMREHILIDDLPLWIIDTAGLRPSENPIEQEGIKRAWQEINKADCLLLMIDCQQQEDNFEVEILDKLPSQVPLIKIFNKIDTLDLPAKEANEAIYLSAKTGIGIDLLKNKLKTIIGFQPTEGQFLARKRHLEALEKANDFLTTGLQQLNHVRGELLALDLRLAHQALGEITGEFTSDDLLGKIFTSFCIGK